MIEFEFMKKSRKYFLIFLTLVISFCAGGIFGSETFGEKVEFLEFFIPIKYLFWSGIIIALIIFVFGIFYYFGRKREYIDYDGDEDD